MLSIFATAAARAAPSASAEGSLKRASSVIVALVERVVGEGVAGMFTGASDADAGAGAAGIAGVRVTCWAGVDGGIVAEEAMVLGLGGGGFGFPGCKYHLNSQRYSGFSTFDIMHTIKPFSSIL